MRRPAASGEGGFRCEGARYDLIAAVNGHRPILDYWRALEPGGACIILGGSLARIFQGLVLGPILSRMGNRTLRNMLARTNDEDLVFLASLAGSGMLTPVIDRIYPLGSVAEAITYLIEEHARGKVVITIE